MKRWRRVNQDEIRREGYAVCWLDPNTLMLGTTVVFMTADRKSDGV